METHDPISKSKIDAYALDINRIQQGGERIA